MAEQARKAEEQQRREDWIRVIRHMLAQATAEQLREVYFLIQGYLRSCR